MYIIINSSKSTINKLIKLNFEYYTFDEIFNNWLNNNKSKKPGLRTPEVFSLGFNSLLQDLKKSLFIKINSKEEINLIKNNFKILEYYE